MNGGDWVTQANFMISNSKELTKNKCLGLANHFNISLVFQDIEVQMYY